MVLNDLKLNNVMVNNGLYVSADWGMKLWSDKRNWRDVFWRMNHSLSTLQSNALTPTDQPNDQSTTASHHHMKKLETRRRNFGVTCILKPKVVYCFQFVLAVNDFPVTLKMYSREKGRKCQMEG